MAYPSNMPITTTSLIQFILANCQPLVRWQASFELCGRRCLLHNLSAYRKQADQVKRRLRVTQRDLDRLQGQMMRQARFRHEKHERECKAFARHLSSARRRLRRESQSLARLLHLLAARIRRFVSGRQPELTRDLLRDMLMLIQEPSHRAPALKAIKKRKAKKSGGKRKKQDKDEL